MIYFVYLIKSNKENWYYVGFTKNINKRLLQHNNGEVASTKSHAPLDLVFVHIANSRGQARDLEKFLKVRFNKEALLDII